MAIGYEDRRFVRRPGDVVARAFAFGGEAPPYSCISARLGSLFERGERGQPEDRPPLGPALAKLGGWLLIGTAATSVVVVCVGALVVQFYTGTFG
jgi:hypothetical protein